MAITFFGAGPAIAADSAKPDDKELLKKYFAKFKKLPTGASSYSKVRSLALKLIALDPRRALTFMKVAITKISIANGDARANVNKLLLAAIKVVEKSDLPDSVKARIIKNLDPIPVRPKPFPTPTPPFPTS